MKESNIIDEIKDRISNLEKRLKGNKDKKQSKEDEDVCPKCGGDLLFVEQGVTFCPKCKKYFEDEEVEE